MVAGLSCLGNASAVIAGGSPGWVSVCLIFLAVIDSGGQIQRRKREVWESEGQRGEESRES